ncbi:MAG: hypothetical protein QJR14_01885 [Bacillota bacterium]|nr:hypothetical protein [Bacillota bacterium]
MSARLARFPAALVLALALVLVPGPVAAGAAAAAPAPGGPVVASSLRWVITLQGGAPVVLELVTLVNTGSEATSAWSWQLPAGAREAALQTGGGTARLSGGRLTDTRGLAPGEQRSYAVRYRLPWTVPGEFRLRPSLPVGAVAALVDEGSVRLSGPGWVRLGVVSTAGRALRQYALDEPLAPGQTVRFTLTPPDWWYEHGTGFLAGVWVALLAGVPALALWLWRRTRPERELERVRRALEQVERLRTEGRLAEDRYRLRRQQLVDEAAELWPKVGGGPRRAG